MKRTPIFLGALAVLLTACDAQQPLPTAVDGPSYDVSAAAATVHLVRFNNKASSGLDASVAALGGQVTFKHLATGIAIVSGLSDEAAESLGALKGVSEVVADESFQLDD